jgi:hypothetical protein
MKTRWSSLGPLALALWLSGCLAVTVNVTFPQESIDSAASSIESLVRGGGVPPVPKTPPPGRQGAAPGRSWWAALAPAVAEAQVPEIKTYTPEVLAIVESRRARYPQLAAAMASGCLGENNQGLVEPRPGSECPPSVGALAALSHARRTEQDAARRTSFVSRPRSPRPIARRRLRGRGSRTTPTTILGGFGHP